MISNQYHALDRALVLDGMGYVCTTATTLDTTVKETKPVLGEDNKPKRDANGKVLEELGPFVKKAKTAIGTWADAEPGEDATKRRFLKQLNRIEKSAIEYGVDQDENNLGVGIITSKSGIVVLDLDAGKVPDVNDLNHNMDAEAAHDLLLERLLKVAGISNADLDSWINQFRQLVHVRTPSGGWHYYFRRQLGQKPRTHTGLISHVDIRAGFKNDEGDWESSGLAYAPGNVTAKGEYIIFQVDVDGHPSRLKSLPPVNDLPFLPEKINSLFERSTTEIREIAHAMAIPVPKTNERYFRLRDKTFSRSMVDTDADLSKWDVLAREFVQKAFELRGGSHEC